MSTSIIRQANVPWLFTEHLTNASLYLLDASLVQYTTLPFLPSATHQMPTCHVQPKNKCNFIKGDSHGTK